MKKFENEIKVLASLEHANLPTIYEIGKSMANLPFVAMDFVNGLRIDRYCSTQKLSLNERIDLFSDVCMCLNHIHGKGIIHRDIKPENFLVHRRNHSHIPKIIDFGHAKMLGHQENVMDDSLAIGTIGFMSPEQQKGGRNADIRSDIYSLGALLEHMLFDIENTIAEDRIQKIKGVCAKAKSIDPEKRHQNCPELVSHLEDVSKG